ncbi:MAG: radical SAM protein, partial [Candidatus Heimdallarchaeaceae archaeon]
ELGRCNVDSNAYIASAFIHLGEESPIVPSGTIFFYGCTMRCVFCQNYDISQEYNLERFGGKEVSPHSLALLYENLVNQRVININFVGGEPTPNLHIISESMLYSKVNVPMLWNSNMYLSEKSMNLIADLFDIWLPDMKYSNNECAKHYSKIKNYWDVLKRNMKMIEEKGSKEYIIRHLVMPNHVECCSLPILDWIHENLEASLVNIMGQYRPVFKVQTSSKYVEIQRRPLSTEMRQVKNHARKLGLFWESVS